MRPDMAEPAPSYMLHVTMSLPHAPNESAILSSKDENGCLWKRRLKHVIHVDKVLDMSRAETHSMPVLVLDKTKEDQEIGIERKKMWREPDRGEFSGYVFSTDWYLLCIS